jgi:predicted dehydrogenase
MRTSNEHLNVLKVLIVGCGNIAGRFDMNRDFSDFPYTHAGAYARDNRFKILACVEPDVLKRNDFMSHWNILVGFSSINEVLGSGLEFDVISICSPTSNHAHDIEFSLGLAPKLIFCEKPITSSLIESERLVKKCKAANVILAVNQSRRWDPKLSELKVKMLSGQMGTLRSIIGIYNKGVLNNGSHMLDLLNFLIGPVKIKYVGTPIYDFSPEDPTIPAVLETESDVPIYMACAHAKDYAVFELQLIFSKGVISMEEGGMLWSERDVVASKKFKGYMNLDHRINHEGKFSQSMINALDNIYHAISHGGSLNSTGESALLSQRVCEEIKFLSQQTSKNNLCLKN